MLQDLGLMEGVLAAAEKVKDQAQGGVRDNSQKQIKTIEWNLNFLKGNAPVAWGSATAGRRKP